MSTSTSHLTRFFRNRDQFRALAYLLLPDLFRRMRARGETTLQVLSAGCSTGEEPYSLAILLSEIGPDGSTFEISAVDRSREALAKAERGLYDESAVAGIRPRLLDRYFARTSDGYAVLPALRRTVRFELGEIEGLPVSGPFDLVVCRNVLTYVAEADRPEFAARLDSAMADYSYLLLGGAESLLGVDSRFEYITNDWCAAYLKRIS